MRSPEFKALLDRYSRNECTPEEVKLIHEWYDSIGSAEDQIMPVDTEQVRNHIWAKVKPGPTLGTQRWHAFTKVAAAIAAVAILSVVVYQVSFRRAQPVEVANDETVPVQATDDKIQKIANNTSASTSIRLPDGSTVTLKPNSFITFDKEFKGDLREVKLSGEAFFNVRRDVNRPFRVYSEEIVTQVLGTSFTVKAWRGDKVVTVAVKSGKVSVYANHDKKEDKPQEQTTVILVPNQQAVYNRTDDKVVKQLVEHPEIILPKSNLFTMNFDEAPVSEIFDVLEKNYGIDIVYDQEALEKCTLTTAMSDEGLFERIEVICKAINAKYQVSDAMILIESPGCK